MKYVRRNQSTNQFESDNFWSSAFAWRGSASPIVFPRVLVFVNYALLVALIHQYIWKFPTLDLTPFDVFGGVIGIFLVFRSNAGYERWWEARKIWGGIVNQSRNIAVGAASYGPQDKDWLRQVVLWSSVFPYLTKHHLRGDNPERELKSLFGDDVAQAVQGIDHKPLEATRKIASLLQQARDRGSLDPYAFMNLDKERMLLLDYVGACERILKTPMPYAYAIKVRRFVLMFLVTVPFAIVTEFGWFSPVILSLIAYPMLSLDQIGHELQNPFAKNRLSHLPLDEICLKIKTDLAAVVDRIYSGPDHILDTTGVFDSLKSLVPSEAGQIVGAANLHAEAKPKPSHQERVKS